MAAQQTLSTIFDADDADVIEQALEVGLDEDYPHTVRRSSTPGFVSFDPEPP